MADDDILSRVLASAEDASTLEDEILKPLLKEIDLIKDPFIMSFVRVVLLNAPPSFWVIPSTLSSEDQRPPDELLRGGNVLHTRRVAHIAHLLADARSLEDEDIDRIVAAALLHDLTKGGTDDSEFEYDYMHPYTVEHWIEGVRRKEFSFTSEDQSSTLWTDEGDISKIMRLIRCSEGPWSPILETIPNSTPEWILHYANLVATHLHRIVDAGAEVQYWRWIPAIPDQG